MAPRCGWRRGARQEAIVTKSEYATQKAELTTKLEAARAQAGQHRRRRYAAEQALDALRATLRRRFAGFVLMTHERPKPSLPPQWGACLEAWASRPVDGYSLVHSCALKP
jgi:hypothetical protein